MCFAISHKLCSSTQSLISYVHRYYRGASRVCLPCTGVGSRTVLIILMASGAVGFSLCIAAFVFGSFKSCFAAIRARVSMASKTSLESDEDKDKDEGMRRTRKNKSKREIIIVSACCANNPATTAVLSTCAAQKPSSHSHLTPQYFPVHEFASSCSTRVWLWFVMDHWHRKGLDGVTRHF